jgi:biopolymer transport protein ExbD
MKGMAAFADIMTNLFVAFAVIVVLLFAKVSEEQKFREENFKNKEQEYVQTIELLKRELQTRKGSVEPGESDLVLSITKDGHFIVEEGRGHKRKDLDQLSQVRQVLRDIRPSNLYLRVDQAVPTGTTQTILADSEELGILGFLVLSGKGA